jgi:hypothetical protein
MSWLAAVGQGFGQVWRYRRAVLVFYVLVVFWALSVAYPLHHLFENAIGNSLLVKDMVKGFDYTLLNDFKNNYGAGLAPIWDQSLLAIGLSMLSMVFAMGGLLSLVVEQPRKYIPAFFWGQSVTFFWRMLRLTVYFMLLHGIVLALFLFLFYTASNGLSPFNLENEGVIAFNLKWVTPLYILVAAFFFLWQDYSKIILVEGNKKWIFQALWPALKFIGAYRGAYGLYLLNGLMWALLVVGNYYLYVAVDVVDLTTILFSFFISQVYVLLRLTLKVVLLGSLKSWRDAQLAKEQAFNDATVA